jgi:hypothetical protein
MDMILFETPEPAVRRHSVTVCVCVAVQTARLGLVAVHESHAATQVKASVHLLDMTALFPDIYCT